MHWILRLVEFVIIPSIVHWLVVSTHLKITLLRVIPTMTCQNSQVRFYVSLIGSGEGRHTTHLLKCVLLLSTSQTDWKQSSDVLSDISFDILSDISSDISCDILFDILSDISSEILSDISFDILSDILSDISFNLLSDISFDILSDISKTKQSMHSFTQKPLHKLYFYLTPRSKSNIHDNNFVSVKWQFYSCSRLHRTAPPRSSWVQRCKAPLATHTHTTCIKQPRQKSSWVPRCHASEHTAATTSHGVCKPWSQMLATVPLAPLRCNWPCSAQHWFATHALQPPKRTPKFERLEHAAPTLARPHLEQLSLHTPHTTKFPPQPVAQWTYNPQHA